MAIFHGSTLKALRHNGACMNIGDLLTRDALLLSRKASSYDAALEQAAAHLSYVTELRPQQIHQALIEREAKGSTGLGNGVALPHARIEGLRASYGLFLHLIEPVDARAPDGQAVDCLFIVLAPESANASYLRAVGKIATILRDNSRRNMLRSGDKEVIYATLTSEDS